MRFNCLGIDEAYHPDCMKFANNQEEENQMWLYKMGSTTTEKSNSCSNDCSVDGYFAEGVCLASFCQCHQGYGLILLCPDALKFDNNSHSCNRESEIDECQPTQTSSTTTSTSPPSPMLTTEAPPPMPTTEASSPVATTEASSPIPTTEAPSPVATTEVSSPVATTEASSPVATTEAVGGVHEEMISMKSVKDGFYIPVS